MNRQKNALKRAREYVAKPSHEGNIWVVRGPWEDIDGPSCEYRVSTYREAFQIYRRWLVETAGVLLGYGSYDMVICTQICEQQQLLWSSEDMLAECIRQLMIAGEKTGD